ncbi:MAG: hypothetical protein FWC33_02160 [Candidatus Bathyarchaeota archaeon]|nr:hypothetical protein [Candidatus Termiticorpusculum sp.]
MCDCGCNKDNKDSQENVKIAIVKPQDHGQCCCCLAVDVDLSDGFMCAVCCAEHEKDLPAETADT